MEAFIGYVEDTVDVELLAATLEAWAECDGAEVKHIGCDPNKFEVQRRVAADNLAEGRFYLLVDVGCVPASPDIIKAITAKVNVRRRPRTALLGLTLEGTTPTPGQIPTGVRICLKNAVQKWFPQSTETYDTEHAQAIELHGKEYSICPDIFYKRIQGPLLFS